MSVAITSAAHMLTKALPGSSPAGRVGPACSRMRKRGSPVVVQSPGPTEGGLTQGLSHTLPPAVSACSTPPPGKRPRSRPSGRRRVQGFRPGLGAGARLSYPVLYFTVHDDRPAESRLTAGIVPYDWLFRVDPFAGVITPLAASYDFQSEGPIGVVANGHYLALTVGCCTTLRGRRARPDATVRPR